MKQLRRIAFWCHLVTGVTVGLVVLVLAATGVLMSYERQIVDWADMRGLDRAGTTADTYTPAELLAVLPDSLGAVASLTWRSGDSAPVTATFERGRSVFLDARTGEIVGEPNARVRAIFEGVLGVHRWLAAPDGVRGLGRSVTGLANLALLFMVATGLFLWWPRNWTKVAVRNAVLFRRGLSRKARNFNRHNVLGIWSALPLLVIAATGVMISYPAAGDAVFALYERVADERPAPAEAAAGVPGSPPGDSVDDSVDDSVGDRSLAELRRIASERIPDWKTLTLDLSATSGDRVVFVSDRGTGGQPHKKAELILDRSTGGAVEYKPFGRESAGTRFFETIRYVHTGEVFGVAGQLVAGLVSLALVFLVWTGLTMAWMRWMRSVRRRST